MRSMDTRARTPSVAVTQTPGPARPQRAWLCQHSVGLLLDKSLCAGRHHSDYSDDDEKRSKRSRKSKNSKRGSVSETSRSPDRIKHDHLSILWGCCLTEACVLAGITLTTRVTRSAQSAATRARTPSTAVTRTPHAHQSTTSMAISAPLTRAHVLAGITLTTQAMRSAPSAAARARTLSAAVTQTPRAHQQ